MTRILDLRANATIWLVLAALVWFTGQSARGSIVGADDDLGDDLSAKEPEAAGNESEATDGTVSADTTAAAIRIDPPGDFNGSGLVEQGDLDLVLTNWGQELALLPTIWVNDRPTNRVDQSALDQVLINWGKAATFTSPVAHMPEASSMTVALLLMASVIGARAAYRGIERRRSPVA